MSDRPDRLVKHECVAAALLALAVGLAGCETPPCFYTEPAYTMAVGPGTVLSLNPMDRGLENRILALNPEHISDADVRDVLSRAPAPRIISLHGSVPLISMESFSKFLMEMGYPGGKVRDPRTGAYTASSSIDCRKLAGQLAWYYEREGFVPILIGHSQGGMKVLEVLHTLSGDLHGRELSVWNPVTNRREDRHTIVDPLTGVERAVADVKVDYATAIATGRLMRILLCQWHILSRIRQVPDSISEFTGIALTDDFLGNALRGSAAADRYIATGTAVVRNVTLPGGTGHLTIPQTEHLAKSLETRRWINDYVPVVENPEQADGLDADSRNILFAAEVWFEIKKHWCRGLQKWIRAKRKADVGRRE